MSRFRIVNCVNDKAITVSQGQLKTHPNDLILQSFTGSPFQVFNIEYVKDKQCKIGLSTAPNKVWDVPADSKDVYRNIICYEAHGGHNQRWNIEKISQKEVQIISVSSGLALELQGGIDADGMLVVQNKNYKNRSQRWRIQPVN